MNKRRPYYNFRLQYMKHKLQMMFQRTKSINLFVIIVLGLFVSFFAVKIHGQLYSQGYTIDKVTYSKESVTTYYDASLYNNITLFYLCRYYSDIKIFGDHNDYKQQIKALYPFIDDIQIENFSNNTLGLNITFLKPLLRFSYKDKIYGAYRDNLILLGAEDSLGHGLPLVLLPIYLKDSSASISGLLYNLDIDKVLYDVLLLKTIPIVGTITYIPGGDKYIYWNDSLRIYFNAKKNLFSQILLLSTLMTQYKGFNEIHQIDVGSLDNPIIK